MILHPCELKGDLRICSWDPKIIIECGCPDCEACRRVFGGSSLISPAGFELTAEYDRITRSRKVRA